MRSKKFGLIATALRKAQASQTAGFSMKNVFLHANGYVLRSLEEADLEGDYFGWLNDARICEFNSHATYPNNRTRMLDYFRWTQETRDAVVLAIVDEKNTRHIGNVSLQSIDWIGRSAEFAILVGAMDYWGKGVGYETGKLLIDYGFSRLNLHKVYCGTSEHNMGMQKLAAKLGMIQEGVRRQAMYKFGRYVDLFEYGVLREEFYAAVK